MTHSDAIVRRQLRKSGLIVAGAQFCPEALFDRRAAADGEMPDAVMRRREDRSKELDSMTEVAETGNTFGLATLLACRHLGRVLLP